MIRTSPVKVGVGSISTIGRLCDILEVPLAELQALLAADRERWYEAKEIPKNDGGIRIVHRPCPELRRVQRRINRRILSRNDIIQWPSYLYGSLQNEFVGGSVVSKDYVACAAVHCGAKSILKVDVKDFYNNVHIDIVIDIFESFLKYPRAVAEALSEICTWKGSLVQGALTSSYLANLCLYDTEGAVFERLRRKSMNYTRLVDDITISSKRPDEDFSYADEMVSDMLMRKGLPVNRSKTGAHYHSSSPLLVHGLRVGFSTPRLLEHEPRQIRAAVRNIELLAEEKGYRQTHSYRHDFNRCMGRVNKLKRVGNLQHRKLMDRLRKVLPMPSPRDVIRARRAIDRLESDASSKVDSYGYKKRYYILQERLNVLARRYADEAARIRSRMAAVRPRYKE